MSLSPGEHGEVALLEHLVRYESVSARPVAPMAGWLAERATAQGFSVELFEKGPGKVNVVARKGPPSEHPDHGLVLTGHMDVVPVEGQAWTTDPFVLTEREEGVLTARGACDMKGFLAATTAACDRLAEVALQRELVLVWTCDEEVGCQGAQALVDQLRQRSDLAPLPSPTVVGEPTGFRIGRLHPGHATWRIVCRGRPAHASRPTLGLSAIWLLTRVLEGIERLDAHHRAHPRFADLLPTPWTVLNAGLVSGGSAVNIVPEHATVTVGARPLPDETGAQVQARLEEIVSEVDRLARREGGSVTLETVQIAEPLHTPAGCVHEAMLAPWASDPAPTGVSFATDGGVLAQLGCRPLVFGPGSIDVAHKPDEFITRADLHTAVRALVDLIGRACVAPV